MMGFSHHYLLESGLATEAAASPFDHLRYYQRSGARTRVSGDTASDASSLTLKPPPARLHSKMFTTTLMTVGRAVQRQFGSLRYQIGDAIVQSGPATYAGGMALAMPPSSHHGGRVVASTLGPQPLHTRSTCSLDELYAPSEPQLALTPDPAVVRRGRSLGGRWISFSRSNQAVCAGPSQQPRQTLAMVPEGRRRSNRISQEDLGTVDQLPGYSADNAPPRYTNRPHLSSRRHSQHPASPPLYTADRTAVCAAASDGFTSTSSTISRTPRSSSSTGTSSGASSSTACESSDSDDAGSSLATAATSLPTHVQTPAPVSPTDGFATTPSHRVH